jgi:hypothetical protein
MTETWVLVYVNPLVRGSRQVYRADSRENVIWTAKCQLWTQGVLYYESFVEFIGLEALWKRSI